LGDLESESGRRWTFDEGERLGEGSFGAVYAGHDTEGGQIAVKKLELVGPRALPLKLYLREVEISDRIVSSQLTHLLPVIDHVETDKSLFLIMHRAQGSLARELLGELTNEKRIQVMSDVITGLEQLHGLPILHRELKPQNILIENGIWKLADFGISKDLESVTKSWTFRGAGTALYMAPELFDSAESASAKSDLYAFGCVAYELWTGHPPFVSTDREELARTHRQVAVPPLSEDINPGLRRVILRLLAKNPSERQQDAREVKESLSRLVEGRNANAIAMLQELALDHTREQAERDDAQRRLLEEQRTLGRNLTQARETLKQLILDGFEILKDGLPEAEYYEPTMTISSAAASLSFQIWQNEVRITRPRNFGLLEFSAGPNSTIRRDDHLVNGTVSGSNRRMSGMVAIGNLVCQIVEGRLERQIMRFQMMGVVPSPIQGVGTKDRRFGFNKEEFESPMIYPYAFSPVHGINPFAMTTSSVSPESIVDLFLSAMALPKDVSR
jgi:serine/threonine protein kinase